jgi:hypothetical protein
MCVIRRRSFYDSSAVHFRINPGDFDNPFIRVQRFSDSHQGYFRKRNEIRSVKIQIFSNSHQGYVPKRNEFRSLKI